MLDIREKLIALLDVATKKFRFDAWENTDRIANFLISNGVTFATDNNDGCKWIPASEPPKKEGWYQVHTSPEKGHRSINKAQYCKEPSWSVNAGKGSWHGSGGIWTNVTHWKPLPLPPKEDE